MNPFKVVQDFEQALCEYTGAPYAVTTNSCTMALQLAVAWHLRAGPYPGWRLNANCEIGGLGRWEVEIPKRTYVGVPMAIIHAGGRPTFRDEDWRGFYQLRPLPVWDCARYFTSGMAGPRQYLSEDADDVWHMFISPRQMKCVSFHWNKTLGIQQGGAILHDDPAADRWLRMARFDGRQEGVPPAEQKEWIIGHHCYMSPEVAAAGLVRLHHLPRHNASLPADNYPDLSTMEIFR